MKDDIADALGIAPIEKPPVGELIEARPVTISNDPDSKSEADYEYARTNFYNVIEKGSQALDDMLDLAKASEHPRAYEVVSTIMKTLVDANKDLVAMSEKKEKDSKQETQDGKNVTNNNLFVGSTAELQQLLKDMRNDDPTD